MNSAAEYKIINIRHLHEANHFKKRFSEFKAKFKINFFWNAHFCTDNANVLLV